MHLGVRPRGSQGALQGAHQCPAFLVLHSHRIPTIKPLAVSGRYHRRKPIVHLTVGRLKMYQGKIAAVGGCDDDTRSSKIDSNSHATSLS
jgi:hypothetical protein